MDSTQYKIACHGIMADGFDKATVLDNLVSMFKLTHEQAAMIVSDRATVLKRNLGKTEAERFAKGLARAGLTCDIIPEKHTGGQHHTSPPSSLPADETGILKPPPTPSSIRFTPVNCPALSENNGNLDTGRADIGIIPYSDMTCMMVWAEESPNGQAYRLVFFVAGQRRPFEASDTAMRFHSFPDVAATTAREGIARFVKYLRNQNPRIYIDEHTASFLDGKLPLIAEKRPLAHITAIGSALIAHGVISDE